MNALEEHVYFSQRLSQSREYCYNKNSVAFPHDTYVKRKKKSACTDNLVTIDRSRETQTC